MTTRTESPTFSDYLIGIGVATREQMDRAGDQVIAYKRQFGDTANPEIGALAMLIKYEGVPRNKIVNGALSYVAEFKKDPKFVDKVESWCDQIP